MVNMQPVIVMPLHDPSGLVLPHLEAITPQLKTVFAQAFVSITTITQERQAKYITWLEQDNFFQIHYHQTEVLVGDDFLALYAYAANACQAKQILHLCFVDRVAFALQSNYRDQFMADIQRVRQEDTPLIFQRSSAAWNTHPGNYRELEQMVTKVGQLLFKKSLDFAWCYLAVQAQQLKEALRDVRNHDLSIGAEIVLHLRDKVQTRDVDWLAWEDPFIYGRNAQQLKEERERSNRENRKRLAYVIPMLQLLYAVVDDKS
jgi:hypothetical protein